MSDQSQGGPSHTDGHIAEALDFSGIIGAVVSALLYYALGTQYFRQAAHKQNAALFAKE